MYFTNICCLFYKKNRGIPRFMFVFNCVKKGDSFLAEKSVFY